MRYRMNTLADIQLLLEDPAKVLVGVQRLIESHTDVPKLTSSVLSLAVIATYLDEETISSMIDAVPPEQRNGLIESLALISRSPVPGASELN